MADRVVATFATEADLCPVIATSETPSDEWERRLAALCSGRSSGFAGGAAPVSAFAGSAPANGAVMSGRGLY
jgi:hypothetical protein